MPKRKRSAARRLIDVIGLRRYPGVWAANKLMSLLSMVVMMALTNAFVTLSLAAAATDSESTKSSVGAPTIAVSIKPLHSLVAAVTRGVTEPVLLFDGFSSPHTATLKPSMLRRLHNADVLVWVGAGVEAYLARVVADLDADTGVVSFGQIDGIRRLPFRIDQHDHTRGNAQSHAQNSAQDTHSPVDQANAGEHSQHESAEVKRKHDEHSQTDDHVSDEHQQDSDQLESIDYHFWLDPHNAAQLVEHLSHYLADIDPANAQVYESNAQQMLEELDQVDQQLAGLLANLTDVSYLVFHDSFQYLEQRYGLQRAMVIAEQPEIQPGARRLKSILRQVQARNVKCLFAEPQFPAKVVSMLQRDSSVDVATLDPLASRYDAGPDLYPAWLLDLGQTVHDCLAP